MTNKKYLYTFDDERRLLYTRMLTNERLEKLKKNAKKVEIYELTLEEAELFIEKGINNGKLYATKILNRNYKIERAKELEKYKRLSAKIDKKKAEQFTQRLEEWNYTFAGWLNEQIDEYMRLCDTIESEGNDKI